MKNYRSYKNAEEFLQAWKEHGPFFKITKCDGKCNPAGYCSVSAFFDHRVSCFLTKVDEEEKTFMVNAVGISYDELLENAIWSDGTLCGIEIDGEKRYNSHTYVDLGLPSGTKWATMNIGAEKETDYGLYFAWGETQGYSGITDEKKFSWDDYKYGTRTNLTKYNSTDGLTTLEPSDDAATVNWGGKWRMPTVEQINELLDTDNCTNEWVTDYNGSGVNGVLFTSVRNENKLFVPTAGYCGEGSLYDVGELGYVWSCALLSGHEGGAQGLNFDSDGAVLGSGGRCIGLPVRSVFA